MKTLRFSLILLAFMAFAQTTWAQLPCLPGHGETEDQTAWCGFTQTIALAAGWNWISSNVVITMDDLKAALVDTLPGTAITIKSKNDGYANYTGTRWKGTLSTIDLTQMYQVQVTSACEITLTGEPIDPTEYPITIVPGVNWIAFPFAESMTLADAFAGFAMSGDNIKSKNDGFANYTNRWKGVLTNLVPGQGYIFTSPSSETRTLVFPMPTSTAKSAPSKVLVP